MATFEWKILGVTSHDGLITHAHYQLTAIDGQFEVSTQGEHEFQDKTIKTSFEELREQDICGWIEYETGKNGSSLIKLNLEKQIEELKVNKNKQLPWLANTFTI